MSKLLIKRTEPEKNLTLDDVSVQLEYGELGLCQNRLHFGDSYGNSVSVALESDVQIADKTKLTQLANKRTNGIVLPIQYDKAGNLAVCIPYVTDNPAQSKKIQFDDYDWYEDQSGTYEAYKLSLTTGYKDINYSVDVVEWTGNTTAINVACTIERVDNSGTLNIYSNHPFRGYVIVTSGGTNLLDGRTVPDIRYISFEPNRITEANKFNQLTIQGKLKIELVGGGIQDGDTIELCIKRIQSGDGMSRKSRLRPVFAYSLAANEYNSRVLTIPFSCRLDKLLRYPQNSNTNQPRRYYPLYLRMKRATEQGHDAYYSLPTQLHPNYTVYRQALDQSGELKYAADGTAVMTGGWFTLS